MTKIKTKLLVCFSSFYMFFIISQCTSIPTTNRSNFCSLSSYASAWKLLFTNARSKEGGLTSSISVGLTDRFQLGLSFGSANLIGDDSLVLHPKPETNLKYLLIDETESIPGISIGINTQGMGKFNSADSLMRYDIKAMGLYAASSKNWITPLGNMGLHFGTNYNFMENGDGDKDLNYFAGIDIEFNPELSFLMEYNAALNENDMTAKTIAINKGGYLNAAIRWTFVERLHIELDFNNLLFDKQRVDYFNRELKITYIEYF